MSDSEQTLAKKVKLHYDTQSSDSSQEVNNMKEERQKRYRGQPRKKLKNHNAERRQRQQNTEIIAELSTSSNINRMKSKNEDITDANSQNLSGLEGTQTSFVQENEHFRTEKKNAIKKKKERQERYRKQNREKLKKREAERRQRQQNSEIIAELSTSSNINRIESYNKEKTDPNSQSLSGLEGTQTSSVQENERAEKKNAIQKKKERQERYRKQNREKLKQREAERRKIIAESSTSSNIDYNIALICEAVIDD